MQRFCFILPLLLSGCLGTEYYDVATDEIITPEGITNVIPQEGAVHLRVVDMEGYWQLIAKPFLTVSPPNGERVFRNSFNHTSESLREAHPLTHQGRHPHLHPLSLPVPRVGAGHPAWDFTHLRYQSTPTAESKKSHSRWENSPISFQTL